MANMERPHVGVQPTAFTEATAGASINWRVQSEDDSSHQPESQLTSLQAASADDAQVETGGVLRQWQIVSKLSYG